VGPLGRGGEEVRGTGGVGYGLRAPTGLSAWSRPCRAGPRAWPAAQARPAPLGRASPGPSHTCRAGREPGQKNGPRAGLTGSCLMYIYRQWPMARSLAVGNAWCGKWEHFSISAWSWVRCPVRVADLSSAVSGFRAAVAGSPARLHEFVEEAPTVSVSPGRLPRGKAMRTHNVGCGPRSGWPSQLSRCHLLYE
jgi:hypothetical protein